MATTAAELQILITTRDSASAQLRVIGQDVARLERQVESAGGAFARIGGAMRGLGSLGLAGMGVGAITSGITSAVSAVGSLVTAASDLNEQLSRSGAVFGEASAAVVDFSRTTAQALGISRTEALEAAGSFGTLFRTAGLADEASADMSTNLVRLAADLASFNNLDPREALEKLRSGLAGEAEPLRQVGVLLSDAAVQAEALSLGLVQGAVDATKARAAAAALTEAQVRYNAVARDANATAAQREKAAAAVQTAEAALNKALAGTIPELTEAQKVQARYALILRQTTTAQGDFARTSSSLANATRVIRASFTDIRTELGQALLPTVARLAQAFVQQLPQITAAVRAFAAQVAPILERVFSGDLAGGLSEVAARLGPVLATWSEAFWGWVTAMTPELLRRLGELGGAIFAWIKDTAPPLLEKAIGEWIPAFVEWVVKVLPPLLVELGKIIKAVTDWATTTGKPELEALGLALGAALVAGFATALERLGPTIGESLGDWFAERNKAPLAGRDPLAGVGRPTQLSPAAQAGATGGGGGTTVVDVGGVQVEAAAGSDPEQIARQAGEAVAQEVLQALTYGAATTEPGASPRLAGAGR